MFYLSKDQQARVAVILMQIGEGSEVVDTIIEILDDHPDLRARNHELTEGLIDLLDEAVRRRVAN